MSDTGFTVDDASASAAPFNFGGLASVAGGSVTFHGFRYDVGSGFAGTIGLDKVDATLFPDSGGALTASLGGFSGSYDLADRTLTLSADSLDLEIGSALEARSTSLSFGIDANNPSGFTFDAGTVKLTSPRFQDVSGTLSTLHVDGSGFKIGTADVKGDARLGKVVEADGFDLSVSNLVYTNSSPPQLRADAFGLTATSASLFPGQTVLTSSLTNFAGTYDFDRHALSLSADRFDLEVGSILEATATRPAFNIDTNDPSGYTFAAGQVALSSPKFANIGFTLDSLQVDNGGFTIGTADLSGDATIGHLLQASNFHLIVDDLTYDSAAGTLSPGSIGLTAGTVTLFPGQSAFTATVDGFSASYDVTADALALRATDLDVKFGSILEIDATGPCFSADTTDPTSLVFDSSSVRLSSPRFAGTSGTLTGLHVGKGGFSTGTIVVTGTATLGSVLEVDGYHLEVDGLSYAASTRTLAASGVSATASEVKLFPDSTSAFTTTIVGPRFTADLATGNFSIGAYDLKINAGDVLDIDAASPSFVLTGSQFVVTVGTATATVGRLSNTSDGTTRAVTGTVTGLTITNARFSIAGGALGYVGSIALGPLSFVNPTVGLTNLTYTIGAGAAFDGELTFGADSVGFGLKMSGTSATGLSASATGIAGTLGLSASDYGKFTFQATTVDVNIGTYLALSARAVSVDTGATGGQRMAQFGSITATLSPRPGLSFSGTASHFAIDGDGTFETEPGFGVSLSTTSSTTSFQIPSWLSNLLTINNLALSWSDFSADPADFTIDLSASASGSIPGTSLALSGFVHNLVIDVGKLSAGSFPIIGVDGAGIGVSGTVFGVAVHGDLFLDVLKLGTNNVVLPDSTPPDDPSVVKTVFYGGIDGGFDLEGYAGFEIRIGISEYGPLDVYIEAASPVVIEPISGLTLTDFHAGIQFGHTISDLDGNPITDPKQLATSPDFQPEDSLTVSQWRSELRADLATIVANAGSGSPTFGDLVKDMTIRGGATLFSSYATQAAFRLTGEILFDTKGNVGLRGDLLLGGTVDVAADVLFNFTEVAHGTASVLVYAQAPAGSSNPLVTVSGALTISYASPVPPSSEVTPGATGSALGSSLSLADAATVTAPGIDLDGTSLTVEFWARRSRSDVNQAVIGQGTDPASTRPQSGPGLVVGFDASNRAYVIFGGATLTGPADDGAWHHWAVTYDAGTGLLSLYEDGTPVASKTVATGGLAASGALFTIGGAGALTFGGAVDEVRVWDVARTAADVLANADRTHLGGSTGLVAEWTFDDGLDGQGNLQPLADSSGNGHVATINGSASFATMVAHPQAAPSFGTLTISVGGEVDLGTTIAGKAVGLQIIGMAKFTATQVASITTLNLHISGQLNLNPPGNLLDVAGDLTLDLEPEIVDDPLHPGSKLSVQVPKDFYGALVATPGEFFSGLQNYGLAISGFAVFRVNTTSTPKPLDLDRR